MAFDPKELELMTLLSQNKSYATAATLSKALGISQKTAYRLVDRINRKAQSSDLIESHIGKGFKLNYEKYLLETRDASSKRTAAAAPNERRQTIFLKLLFKSPIKMRLPDLFQEFHIGEASVTKDLRLLHEMAEQCGVKLHKKDNRLWIEGIETAIRQAINTIIYSTEKLPPETKQLSTNFINPYDQRFILTKIDELERELQFQISYPYNVNFYLHLCILIARCRDGAIQSDRFERAAAPALSLEKEQEALYALAEKLVRQISRYLHHDLPEMEVQFIFQYLISSRVKEREGALDNVQAFQVTRRIVGLAREKLSLKVCGNTLVQDLYSHVVPMLNRIANGIMIKNSLLGDIVSEYRKIFHAVDEACQAVLKEQALPPASAEEIGFITLYFAKNIEQHQDNFRVVILCTSGMGTSELLKVKVQKAFANIEIVDVIPRMDFEKNIHKNQTIDFILSTVGLDTNVKIPYLIVNALFPLEDKKRVEKLIGELRT